MFPRISDLINYLLGTNFEIPVQTYGLLMAISFVAAGWILYLELKRKEKEGLLSAWKKSVLKGAPATFSELFLSGFFGFILGWKGMGIVSEYDLFSKDPQDFLISGKGSILAGFLLASVLIFLTYRSGKKKELKPPVWEEKSLHPYQLAPNMALIAAVVGIIGSKIFDTLEHLDDLFRDPFGTIFSFSGLSFYGGLIVAAIAVIWYAHKNKIRFPFIIDAAAPAIILAYAIGRLGCQLSGDGCWGVVNLQPKPEWLSFLPDWMWAFRFPHNVINEGVPIPGCAGEHCHILSQPVFPSSFYETMLGLLIFGILWMIRKRVLIPGYIFCLYLILNGIERFFMEKIRINIQYRVFSFHLTQAEIIAILLVLLGFTGMFYFRYIYQKKQNIT